MTTETERCNQFRIAIRKFESFRSGASEAFA